MSVTFQALQGSKDGRIVCVETSREVQSHQVFIETTHSGVCSTDEIFRHSEMALGHEGVGIVRQVGSCVNSVHVGDRVGFAYVQNVCGSCDKCMTGHDQYCRKISIYGESNPEYGSFGSGVIWDADCVFPIPENYPSEHAAPLLCAGASVWECLQDGPVRPGERVGVLGLGGLGHLAIKLASAIGCEVAVLSTNESKRKDAFDFGANEFHLFDGSTEEAQGIKPLDRILLCGKSSKDGDLSGIVSLMDTKGIIYPLNVTFGQLNFPLLALMAKGVRIQGSRVSSRQNMTTLLRFASQHNITPSVMEFPQTAEGAEDAMEELREGRIRYRAVLVRRG